MLSEYYEWTRQSERVLPEANGSTSLEVLLKWGGTEPIYTRVLAPITGQYAPSNEPWRSELLSVSYSSKPLVAAISARHPGTPWVIDVVGRTTNTLAGIREAGAQGALFDVTCTPLGEYQQSLATGRPVGVVRVELWRAVDTGSSCAWTPVSP